MGLISFQVTVGGKVQNCCGEMSLPTNPAVPEIACDDEEVKNQVKCCVAEVRCDAQDVEGDSMPGVNEEQVSKDLMVRFVDSYSCWYRLRKGIAWLLHCKNWLRAKTRSGEKPPSVITDPQD